MELLEAAQQALAGAPAHALDLLERHRRAFPRGDFAQERDALMLEALHRLQARERLREGIEDFLQRYPRSPHRERIERLAESAP